MTLVETLVASVIMIMGVIGLLAVFPQALGSARASGHMLILNRLAAERLESLRSLPYNAAELTLGTHPTQQFDSDSENYYPVTGMNEAYSLRWVVAAGPTDQSGTPEPDMKTVTVEATFLMRYTSGGAPPRQAEQHRNGLPDLRHGVARAMTRKNEGFSLIELLVGLVVSLVVLFAVLSAYSQANSVKTHVQGTVKIQGNVRLAMDRLSREMRMTGFAVPSGSQMVGAKTRWSPAIFHANQTEIGFRADMDGGKAEIICTPDSTNTDCPLSKLRLDAIDYYQALNCKSPDGAIGGLKLIADLKGKWLPFACTGFSGSDDSIFVSSVPDAVFEAGTAQVATVEQVYYRYVPLGAAAPTDDLLRHMRYGNTPDGQFPPHRRDLDPRRRPSDGFSGWSTRIFREARSPEAR